MAGLADHFARPVGDRQHQALLLAAAQRAAQRLPVDRHPGLAATVLDAHPEALFDEPVQRGPVQAGEQARQVGAGDGAALRKPGQAAQPVQAVADEAVDSGEPLASGEGGQHKGGNHKG